MYNDGSWDGTLVSPLLTIAPNTPLVGTWNNAEQEIFFKIPSDPPPEHCYYPFSGNANFSVNPPTMDGGVTIDGCINTMPLLEWTAQKLS